MCVGATTVIASRACTAPFSTASTVCGPSSLPEIPLICSQKVPSARTAAVPNGRVLMARSANTDTVPGLNPAPNSMKLLSPITELLGRLGQPLSLAATTAITMMEAPPAEFGALTLIATSASASPFEAQMLCTPGATLEGTFTVAAKVPCGVNTAEPMGIGICDVCADLSALRHHGALHSVLFVFAITLAAEL